jgi:hypothetical protein
MRIPVSGKDAERLLAAGVIADVQVLRQRVRFCCAWRKRLLRSNRMGVDWDLHLLSPLHGVFGDEHEYRPKGTPSRLTAFLTVGMPRLLKTSTGIQ